MTNDEKIMNEVRELIRLIKTMWSDDSTHDDVKDKAEELSKLLPDE